MHFWHNGGRQGQCGENQIMQTQASQTCFFSSATLWTGQVKHEGIILPYLVVERGAASLMVRFLACCQRILTLAASHVHPACCLLTSVSCFDSTFSEMREENLSGPGNVSAKWVLWRASQFWSLVRNVCNYRVNLGTLGYPKETLDFIVFPTLVHLHRIGSSLLTGNLSFLDHCLPISERRV